jgi:hypothetical protein
MCIIAEVANKIPENACENSPLFEKSSRVIRPAPAGKDVAPCSSGARQDRSHIPHPHQPPSGPLKEGCYDRQVISGRGLGCLL